MPTISIYLSDDDVDWLDKYIGRGKVSPYVKSLLDHDKKRVELNEVQRSLDSVLNLGLLMVGLSFVVMVLGMTVFPILGSFGHIFVLFAGGILLILQSVLKIQNTRRLKNGTRNTANFD